MTTCTDIQNRLEERALRQCPPDELPKVEAHLRACAECADIARALEAVARLALGRPEQPAAYAENVLPRLRARLEAPRRFRIPAFALRVVSPALAALFICVLAFQLVPLGGGNASGDASQILSGLPEADLAQLAEHHDSEALITLPAEATEEASPDVDESTTLQDIVENEAGTELYAYLGTDAALGGLADDEQTELISMLEHP